MKKPKLSFWQIWNMSFGFFGIQFGFALQNANVSRIFETLGAKIDEIPILWIAAPLTGLIVQPIVGYMSDRTWTRLGRRRPYFLIGTILSTIALFIMPNSPVLWVAAIMLWILDMSINISMEPFRAFVADNISEEQRTSGFAMQSFFIGVGAVAGSILTWILSNVFHISNTAPEGVIPDSVKWSFYLGGIVFLVSVLWTVIKSKEYTPEELKAHQEKNQMIESNNFSKVDFSKFMSFGILFLALGILLFFILIYNDLDKVLYILASGILSVGVLFLLAGFLSRSNYENAFTTIMSDLLSMPKTMKQLAWVQFFTWFALFSMWIYTTQAVTRHIFEATDTTSKAYNEGADWVGVLFTVYNGIAAIVAFLLPVLAKKTSRKFTHFLALLLGGLGLISFYFITDPQLLLISMIGVGIAWASILSLPYAMLSNSLPADKMGYFMGVFNFFIVIPQLIAATILGFLVIRFFDGDPIYALIVGGVSMLIAGLLTLNVNDKS
jgi:maltose/moltooligosaccharide transporter